LLRPSISCIKLMSPCCELERTVRVSGFVSEEKKMEMLMDAKLSIFWFIFVERVLPFDYSS
jgi:hypothetical protein